MLGIYANKRLSEAETKLLNQNPDDYIWYSAYVQTVFRDPRFFQIREDIKLPQNDDDDSVVLLFEDGDIVYFKTMDKSPTNDDEKAIFEVCLYLEDLFKRPIKAYVVCPSDVMIDMSQTKFVGKGDVAIYYGVLKNNTGEEIIERLENKLKNGEKFTINDSIDHMLLPYSGFKNKEEFNKRFEHYMRLVNECGGR